MTTPDAMADADRIAPDPQVVTLSNGKSVKIRRLGTLELFGLLRILTHGGLGAGILNALDFSAPMEEFGPRFLTILALAIPDAGRETLEFIRSMCEPAALESGPKLTKEQQKDNAARLEAFNEHMQNPPPDDTLAILQAIITQEAPEVQALGKRLSKALAPFQKTGQANGQVNEETALASAAASPETR